MNADPKESNLDVIPGDVLALWQGDRAPSPEQASTAMRAAPAKAPQSLWWYVMLLAFAAAFAESALASRYLGVQRDE